MIYLDRPLMQQPEGTSRFKLNVVQDSIEGAADKDVGEISNRLIHQTSEPYIGSIAIGPGSTVVFGGTGKIYLHENDKFTILKDLPCLNFSEEFPITGSYRTVRGCERIIYWADYNNPDRYFNLDKLDEFQTCNDFSIAPKLGYPSVETEVSESGGSLEYGNYWFVFEYLDLTQNVLLRTVPSDPVIIGNALNLDTFQEEAGGRPKTTRSVIIKLTDVDLRAKYVRVGVISKTSGDGVTLTAHYAGQPIPVLSRTMTYRYVGFNPSNGDILTDFQSLIADHVVFTTSRDITQVSNRLVRLNLKDGVNDYVKFQQAASAIGTSYIVEDVPFGEDVLTEQGDEVKAYGIGFILDDGTRTPPFHIPGPQATGEDRRIISSRYGPGDVDSKSVKRIRMTLDVSTKNAPGRDRDVFINYSFSVSIKKVSFRLTSAGKTKEIESRQKAANIDVEIEGRKSAISIEINVEDLEGARFSRIVQLSDRLERTSFLMETSTTNTFAPEELEKWVVENTAIKDTVAQGGYSSSGRFGIYETEETYVNPSNYCGDGSFWGLDYYGNSLVGEKVRYHRVPCRTIEPLIEGESVRRIGVRFTNIQYPAENVVGHYFVSSTYEETNRTIDSAGYLVPYNFVDDTGADSKDDTGRYLHYLPNTHDNARPTNNTYQNFITLQYLIDHKLPRGRFMKTNGYLNTSYSDNRPLYKKFFKGTQSNLQLFGKHHFVTGFTSAKEFNLIKESQSLLSKTTTESLPNRSLSNDFNIVTLFDNPTIFNSDRANLNYTYMKTGLIPFPAVSQIRYRLLGEERLVALSSLDNFDVFDGDSYLSRVDLTNISKLFGENTLKLLPLILTVGIGAIFLDKEQIHVEYELIEGLVFESPYNYNRRFEGTDPCSVYYNTQRPIDDVIMRRVADRVETDGNRDWRIKDSICMEWYGNNPDYNRADPLKVFYPLGQVFDYCSKCLNKHPNDYVYSEVATTEDGVDNFLVYKPNNRGTLPGDGGEIVKADVVGNNLLVRCYSKTFMLFPSAQELQVTDATVYLGSGSFLAAPPQAITSTSSGFAGQQSKLSSTMTPFGLVWADQIAGAIYHFDGDGVSEISAMGMFHFFEQNMKVRDEEISGSVKMAYDPLWKRVVITSPKFQYIGSGVLEKLNGRYYVGGNEVFLHQLDQFENLSFTISYKMDRKYWASFHSYMPKFMYHNLTTMYTASSDGMYGHNNPTQTARFYGFSFPVGVEINFADIQTFQNAGFHYYAKFERYDLINKVWVDVPGVNFDKAWAYNDSQSSGMVDLFQPGSSVNNIGWSTREKSIVRKDMNCRIASLRSISTQLPVITKAWSQRQTFYSGIHGYIDKVPVNVNYDMPQHEQVLFRDKVLSLRLFISNPDVRMTYHAGTFANMPSNR